MHGGIHHHHRRRLGAQLGIRPCDIRGDERQDPHGRRQPYRRSHSGHHRAGAHVLLAYGVLQPPGHHVRRAVHEAALQAARRGRGRPQHPQDRAHPRVLRGRVRPRPGERGATGRPFRRRSDRHPHRARLPHRHAGLPSRLRLPGRPRRAPAHAAPGRAAHAHRAGQRRDRRRAGWQIIGRTPLKPYDPDREEPILYAAGEYLRFVPITPDEYTAIEAQLAAGTYSYGIFVEGE